MASKLIIMFLLLTTSFFANAESWKNQGFVPEYDAMLWVDDDAYDLSEYDVSDDEKSVRLLGIFVLKSTSEEIKVKTIIDANQCVNDNKGVIVLVINEKRFDEYWNPENSGISDIIGTLMCNKVKKQKFKKETKPKLYM
jgi:hypothetical protein